MFSRLFLLLLLPALLPAKDRWIALKSGPFEVFSDAGDKPVRQKLMYLEQFRETLRVITGKQEMQMVWPVEVIISRSAPVSAKPFALGRDVRMLSLAESDDFAPDGLKALARYLIYENTNRLPPDIEQGIIELVSTLKVDGTIITLGAPVPAPEQSRGWALMHMLMTNPEYAGRTSVFISNVQQTPDLDAACHNAFGKSWEQISQLTDAYIKAGNYATTTISGRALSPTRDFKPVQLGTEDVATAQADLLMAEGRAAEAATAYKALQGPAGLEGLALIDLDKDNDKQARSELQGAIDHGSTGARAWLELGRLNSDDIDLRKASELNPLWAEPYFQRADIDDAIDKEHLEKRALLLKKATSLEPRNIDYWTALAKNDEAAKDFVQAEKAWGGAEHAAKTDQERERIQKLRLSLQAKRYDEEKAEKKQIADAKQADIDRVKAESDAAIHAAELAARRKLNPNGEAVPKADTWYHPQTSGPSVQGMFVRLDCLDSNQARMVIQGADRKTVQLLVADPSKVDLPGGQQALTCGPQKNPRQMLVHYNPKANAKLHTAGEVTSIELH